MLENVTKLVETSSAEWKPLSIPGIKVLPLQADKTEREGTFLIWMAPNATYTRHRHPAGEQMLLLKGDAVAGETKLKAGDFLSSPPGSVHEVTSEGGCVFFVYLPKAIQIVSASQLEEMDGPPEDVVPENRPITDVELDPSLRELDTEP
jgi:quercetin dioxygenase-like cupin family protein